MLRLGLTAVTVLAGSYVLSALCHRFVLHTGQPILVQHVRPPWTPPSPTPGPSKPAACAGDALAYVRLSGDVGAALVAREVLDDRVYFKHGITLPAHGAALVVDIGANIGLFALAVTRDFPGACVVGAEPVPALCALAVRNTAPPPSSASAHSGEGTDEAPCRVVMVPMAVGAAHAEKVPLVVNPFISAGTSMYEATIVRPFAQHRLHARLRAVLVDNSRAGNLPRCIATPVAWALQVPVLRVVTVAALAPVLALLAVHVLAAPTRSRTVYATVGTFQELLRSAAEAVQQQGGGGGDTWSNVEIEGSGPIDLVKIDVEGAEMDVLMGIDTAQWTRIRQLVVEVHDVENRVAAVCALLRAKGLSEITVDHDDWASHELLRIHSVYARKAS